MLTYSIAIRTLGTGGEKYKALLESISRLKYQPSGVYVFIAEGYALPLDQLGWEKFVYTHKGMWHQRVYGIEYIASQTNDDYILVLDDDVSFDEDFTERMLAWMSDNQCDVCIPNLMNRGIKVTKRSIFSIQNIYLSLLGTRVENHFMQKRIKIIGTSGYMANTALSSGAVPTESGPFCVFFIKADKVSLLNLKDEYWLDDTKYALPDDQVFFYKCYLKGLKQYCHLDIMANHLDQGSSNPNRLKDATYASGRNFLIFWHRFLYSRASIQKKLWLIISVAYRIFMHSIFNIAISIAKREMAIIRYYTRGVRDGVSFIKSSDYKKLEKI